MKYRGYTINNESLYRHPCFEVSCEYGLVGTFTSLKAAKNCIDRERKMNALETAQFFDNPLNGYTEMDNSIYISFK